MYFYEIEIDKLQYLSITGYKDKFNELLQVKEIKEN